MVVDHATVNLTRSQDGLTNWEPSLANPEPGSRNCDAVYKPFALYDEDRAKVDVV